MALTKQPRAEVTVTVRDRSSKLGKISIPVTNDTDVFSIDDALAVGQNVDALSDGVVVAISYTQTWYDGTPDVPLLKTPVEQKGMFTFVNDNRETMTLQVPAIGTLYVRDNRRIDEDIPAVVTFTDNIIANGRSKGGNAFTRLDQAYMNNNSTGKTQRASDRFPDADALPAN